MLRMGVRASVGHLKRSLSLRWQVPLFGLSIVVLGLSFLRFHPSASVPRFDEVLDQVIALQRGGFYSEASHLIQKLLDDPKLTKEQQGLLYRTLAETIFLAEQSFQRHEPENARRIVLHHRRALANGLPATAAIHEQMGQALEWVDNVSEAVEEYRKAIAAGSERSGRLRRRIIERLARQPEVSPQGISEELTHLLADPRLEPADLLWAVERRMEGLFHRDQLPRAREFLEEIAPRLKEVGLEIHTKYLLSLIHI